MDFSHFTPVHVLLRGFKNSITFFLKPYLQRYPITLQMRCRTSRSYITLWILFRSHSRLMIAVSYNLWISADHRCWLVGWGAFLIKRQMSGGGILTVWHYKSWHRFKILCLLCCPTRPGGKNQCKVQFTPPKLLSVTGGDYHHLPHNFLFLHLCSIDGFRGQEGGKGWIGAGISSLA